MIANSLFFTIVISLGYRFWLLDQLKLMARYKTVMFQAYGTTVLIFPAVLFVFGVALAIELRFFLKNTGRNPSHLEKQLHMSQTEVRARTLEEEVE
jgi:hypothetical protein